MNRSCFFVQEKFFLYWNGENSEIPLWYLLKINKNIGWWEKYIMQEWEIAFSRNLQDSKIRFSLCGRFDLKLGQQQQHCEVEAIKQGLLEIPSDYTYLASHLSSPIAGMKPNTTLANMCRWRGRQFCIPSSKPHCSIPKEFSPSILRP